MELLNTDCTSPSSALIYILRGSESRYHAAIKWHGHHFLLRGLWYLNASVMICLKVPLSPLDLSTARSSSPKLMPHPLPLPVPLVSNSLSSCIACLSPGLAHQCHSGVSHMFSDSLLSVARTCKGCGLCLLGSPAVSSYLGAFRVAKPSNLLSPLASGDNYQTSAP